MKFRPANGKDLGQIAALHALSWKNTYPGILSQAYLDSAVLEEKRAVWYDRFNAGPDSPWILIAEQDRYFCGFVCVYLNYDSEYGAYMDNLHVSPSCLGMGLGKQLMNQSFAHIHACNPHSGLFLWVFEKNQGAVKFYRNLGGLVVMEQIQPAPGGGSVNALKIAWSRIPDLEDV
jgi:ribosomal protein S18 acetylase RimI-like enzyme